MSNFTHYNDDPLFSAAKAILEGKQTDETPSDLEEGVEEIKAKVKDLKVGDKTNFGTVKKIDASSITFKTKDIPETKIGFNQRKMGSKDFVLDRLAKMNEDVQLDEAGVMTKVYALGTEAGLTKAQVDKVFLNLSAILLSTSDAASLTRDAIEKRLESMPKKKGVVEDVEVTIDPTITEAVGLASDTLKGQVVSLLQLNTSVKVAHWHASTSVNTHKALGDLYDAIESGLDTFAETEMGISKNRQFLNMSCETRGDYSVPALITELRARAEALVNTSKALGCEDLANIAADLLGAVNKAAYLLEV